MEKKTRQSKKVNNINLPTPQSNVSGSTKLPKTEKTVKKVKLSQKEIAQIIL